MVEVVDRRCEVFRCVGFLLPSQIACCLLACLACLRLLEVDLPSVAAIGLELVLSFGLRFARLRAFRFSSKAPSRLL